MRFFHLADLHLGRTLHKYPLIEDQKTILDFVVEQIDLHKPDAVVIAGDIYDRTVPSAEATQLFDYFLTEMSRRGCATMIIAGNHDSATRLSYASNFFKKFNIHIATEYQGTVETVILEKGLNQKYHFHLLPFFKPVQIRRYHPESEIETYQDALSVILKNIDLAVPGKHILVAHQFFVNSAGEALLSDSEQISVGGLDQISADLVKDFDYVALGHLHQPHQVQAEHIRYSGSPLVYSASELARPKYLSLIEFKANQESEKSFDLRQIEFHPLHPVRIIEGEFAELIADARKNPTEDYVYLNLLDQKPIQDLASRFKRFYPRLLEVRTPNFTHRTGDLNALTLAPNEQSLSSLFALFHKEETGTAISESDQLLIQRLSEKGEEL